MERLKVFASVGTPSTSTSQASQMFDSTMRHFGEGPLLWTASVDTLSWIELRRAHANFFELVKKAHADALHAMLS
eukprot:5712301-Alexandrium_andersonii.AAC.1